MAAPDLLLILPELAIVVAVSALALFEIFLPVSSQRNRNKLNLAALSIVGGVSLLGSRQLGAGFSGMIQVDSFSIFFKFLFLVCAAWVVVVKRDEPAGDTGAEFYLLLWSAVLGMFFLVSSQHFIIFFISLELLTLSLYVLAAYTRTELRSIEAGLKYLVLGSLASAFLLYGMSLIYAAAGTLAFGELGALVWQGEISKLFLAGILLVLSALGFKVAAVPFQVWVPDVYQGAPTPVVAFLSVASKSAGFAALLRIFFGALGPLDSERRILFSLLASLTLLYGNLGALVQKDIKRLLGFSSIGHAGFLLVALASDREWGGTPLLYYLVAYAVSNLAAFLVVSKVEAAEKINRLEAYEGLSRRSPLLAGGMFLALLSLAGVPPLAGFFAKFFILLAAARSGLIGVVFLGALNVAISLYYYLSIVRVIYFEKPKAALPIALSLPSRALLLVLIAGIILVGIWQAPFFRLASQAALSLSTV